MLPKREIFAENYNKYYLLLVNIAASKINSRDDAHDIAQEIFMLYMEKLTEVDNPRAWLLGVLKNRILKYYRDKMQKIKDSEEFTDDLNMKFVNGFQDTRLVIKDAIKNTKMNEEERLIFDYVSYYNYSYNKTAEMLGITKRKVGYYYQRSLQKIIAHLKEKGINNIEELL